MQRPLCSVVLATYQRAHLLKRSIVCYNASNFPLDRLEVVVVDDGSFDDTRHVVEMFDRRIDVKYLKLRKPDGLWRDCAAVINHGLRAATGEYVLLTHPEVMPGRDSVRYCVEDARRGGGHMLYTCCKPYYLTPRDQERIDTVNWIADGPLAVRGIEGFYEEKEIPEGHPDFTPRTIERTPTWQSWVFGGCLRSTWKYLGGMIETEKWGSVDLIWHMRRHVLKIGTVTGKTAGTFVVHQNHDDPSANVPPPRDLEAAHAEAAGVKMEPEQLRYPAVDNLW